MKFGRIGSRAIALALTAIGAGAIVAPSASSRQYGLPAEDATARALIRALGFRDLAIGLIALRFLARGENVALADTIGIGSLVAAGDVVAVASVRGAGAHLAIHAAGWVAIAGTYVLERRERDR